MSESLRNIDHIQEGKLLRQGEKNSLNTLREWGFLKPHINEFPKKLIDTIVLTDRECMSIRQNMYNYNFTDTKSYPKNKREASRLCIIDNSLTKILWERLTPILKNLKDLKPYGLGITNDEKWVPFSINNCLRISKYPEKSVGFKYHYDNQTCLSDDRKSILSIVIYLNDSFTGGETIFYYKDDINERKKLDLGVGLTVKEEIELNGGINSYEHIEIKPRTGKCVIFEHDILHEGRKGKDKIVLRTDVIFRRIDEGVSLQICDYMTLAKYKKSAEYFREAQNLELDGKVEDSSELYERALSIKKSKSALNQLNQLNPFCNLLTSVMRDMVLWYLEKTELTRLNHLNRIMKMSVRSYLSVNKLKNYFESKHPNHKTQRIKYWFIPKTRRRYGTQCRFEYYGKISIGTTTVPMKDLFLRNKEKCLRVVAMYTIFMFGHKSESNRFIADYDPKKQEILQCSLEWLLYCAYHNLRCVGSFFQLQRGYIYNEPNCDIAEITQKITNKEDYLKELNSESQPKSGYCHIRKSTELCYFTYNTKTDGLFEDYNKNINIKKDYVDVMFTKGIYEKKKLYDTVVRDIKANNLIFDFGKQTMEITECKDFCCNDIYSETSDKDEGFVVNISKLKPKPFMHAGYITKTDFTKTVSSKIKYSYLRHCYLDKIHIKVTYSGKKRVVINSEYDVYETF